MRLNVVPLFGVVRNATRPQTVVTVDQLDAVDMEIKGRRFTSTVKSVYRPRLVAIVDARPRL